MSRDEAFEALCRQQPALRVLLREAQEVRDDGDPKGFCANAVWYRYFKPRLVRLVGCEAPAGLSPELYGSAAYDVVYRQVYEVLPDCRHEYGWCWPYRADSREVADAWLERVRQDRQTGCGGVTEAGVLDRVMQSVRAQADTMTPARREAFIAGGECARQVLAELAVDEAVGESIRALIRKLQEASRHAEVAIARAERESESARHVLDRFAKLEATATQLDDRGRAMWALAGALTDVFQTHVRSQNPGVQREVVRAISYALWAYAANGAVLPMPSADQEEPAEESR